MTATRSPVDGVRRLQALTPERLRYVRMFIAAGWRLRIVAWLFDADELALDEALGSRAAA